MSINPNDRLLILTSDASRLSFYDHPDRLMKCYDAIKAASRIALGKAVPIHADQKVYHVKKRDLIIALGLNQGRDDHAKPTLLKLIKNGNSWAKAYLLKVEMHEFLQPLTNEKILSPEFERLFRLLIIANDQANHLVISPKNLLIFLLPIEQRMTFFRDEAGLLKFLNADLDLLMTKPFTGIVVKQFADLIKKGINAELKCALAKLIQPAWLNDEEDKDLVKTVLNPLVQFPEKAFLIRTNRSLKPYLDAESLDIAEEQALKHANLFDVSMIPILIPLIIQSLNDPESHSRHFTVDALSDLAIKGVSELRYNNYFKILLDLAMSGHEKSRKALLDMSIRASPFVPCYQQAYHLCSWAIKQDVETLKNLDATSDLFKDARGDALLAFCDFFSDRSDHRIPLSVLQRDDLNKFRSYIQIHAAQKNPRLIFELTSLARAGYPEAIVVLKAWAQKENQEAIKELTLYEFESFASSCSLKVLRSQEFDEEIEKALSAKTSLHESYKFLYLLPKHLRLPSLDEMTNPFQQGPISIETILSNDHESSPIPALLKNIENKLTQEISPVHQKWIADFVIDYQENLGILDESSLFQKALEIKATFETEGSKNPIIIYQSLLQEKKEPVNFSPAPQCVEGKEVSFDLPVMQALASSLTLPQSALHKDVTWEKWQALIRQIDDKQIDPAFKHAIDVCTIGGWTALLHNCLNDSAFFKPRIEFQGERIPLNYAQLNAILHKIFNLSNQGEILSPQEELFIKFAECVKNCKGGKFEGVSFYYVYGLEPEDKFKFEISNEPDPAKAQAKSILAEEFQNAISMAFSGTNPLMQELTQRKEILQASHQSIYLKNLIGHIVGLQHDLLFDMYTRVLYDELICRPRKQVLEIFFNHFTPQVLVEHLHRWMCRDSKVPGRKNWDQIFMLVSPSDEDLLWDPATDMPVEPRKVYARKILEAAGYLKEK